MRSLVIVGFAAIFAQTYTIRLELEVADKSRLECIPLKETIADSIVAVGITFFADHPRGNDSFDPYSVQPFTPSELIKRYYGQEASAVKFTEAISTIAYAAEEEAPKNTDRDDMRRNLYSYIKAGSYDYARRKTGELLRVIVEEYVKDYRNWKRWECIAEDKLFAVSEALEVEYYRIRNEVGDVKFGHFLSLGVGSTLAFVIDDTGSMSTEIRAAIQRARDITDVYRGTLDAPQDFVLVPFNDPGVGPVTVTNDASEYHKALSSLRANGGGDRPELAMRGIQLAIENSRPGSNIYVITDADAKDVNLQDTVIAQAKQKSITVSFLLTNPLAGCTVSTGVVKRCMELYKYIASSTGGKVLIISKGDIFRATKVVQSNTKQGLVTLKKIVFENVHDKIQRSIHFRVDSSIQQLLLQTQGDCRNISVSLPNGIDHLELNVSRYGDTLTSEINLQFVNETWLGQWKLDVDVQVASCEVTIQAKTTMGYVFNLYSRRNDDTSDQFEMLEGDPSVESTLGVTLDGYGFEEPTDPRTEVTSTEIMCVSKNGTVLHSATLQSVRPNELRHIFHSSVTELEPFYIMVLGKDEKGYLYERMHSTLITPSRARIECDLSNLTIVAGSRATSNITIVNSGPEDEFVVSVSDEHKASSLGRRTSGAQSIPSRGNSTTTLVIRAPNRLQDGTAVEITIVARGISTNSFQYQKCTFVVGQKKRPRIDAFSVKTIINARFAETVVTSEVTNNADVGREAIFDMLLPKAAFITAIRIELQNETIHGEIEEKERAKKIFDRAKERGTVAGHVAARDKSTQSYRTSMFVEPRQKVRFVLTYREFLIRTRGRYEYAVILKPDQPIRRLTVDVHISEDKPLKFVRVTPLKTTSTNLPDNVPPGSTVTFGKYQGHVRYHPNITEQTKWSPRGISGTFRIEYDVERDNVFGDVILSDGYFAHFFAPPDLPALPKIVVLVVDISGSMYGYKLNQVVDALTSVLLSLGVNDRYNLVFFGDEASSLVTGDTLKATKENVNKTIADLQSLKAFGGTNMEAAFDLLFETFEPYLPNVKDSENDTSSCGKQAREESVNSTVIPVANVSELMDVETRPEVDLYVEYVKMAVFLTDGRPSIGDTNTKYLRCVVKAKNQNRIAIHTIGLGSLVDIRFLERMAHENGGTSRRIFEEIDADIQIRNFFNEISSPILRDVSFDYPLARTGDLTKTAFPTFFGGAEIVVAGKVKTVDRDGRASVVHEFDEVPGKTSDMHIPGLVRMRGFKGEDDTISFKFDPRKASRIDSSLHKIQNYTEKLWAFLTLKRILLDASIEENSTVKDELNERALNMSLEYGLVTPLTSLVVVKADEKAAIEAELDAEAGSTEASSGTTVSPDDTPESATTAVPLLVEESRSRIVAFEPRRPIASGFVGDPHIILSVKPGLQICFNFDGDSGEIYNFVTEPRRGIVINGVLINSPAPEGAKLSLRTYVSALGVVAYRSQIKILVTPTQIKVLEPGQPDLVISAISNFSVSMAEYDIHVFRSTARVSVVQIGIEGLVFNVTLNRRHSSVSHEHLDFSLFGNLRSLSRGSDGVLGQFRDALLRPDGSGRAILGDVFSSNFGKIKAEIRVRGKNLPVTMQRMPVPGGPDHELTSCWYLGENGAGAMKRPKALFKLPGLFDIPVYYSR